MLQEGKVTQSERILDYIDRHGSISAFEAVLDLGILQLSARICELEKKGYEFTKQRVKSKNRYGDRVYYIRYRLGGRPC